MMRFFSCLVLILLATPAFAEKKDVYPDMASIPRVLLADLRHGDMQYDNYLSRLLSVIREHGKDGASISQADIDARAADIEFQRRQKQYLSLVHYDLDFDATVTAVEVGQIMTEEKKRKKQSTESCTDDANRLVEKYDIDKDGVLSLKELSTPAEQQDRGDKTAKRMKALLAIDPDKDGKLTVGEAEGLARKLYATLDANGDGALSRDEARKAREDDDEY